MEQSIDGHLSAEHSIQSISKDITMIFKMMKFLAITRSLRTIIINDEWMIRHNDSCKTGDEAGKGKPVFGPVEDSVFSRVSNIKAIF